MWPFNRQKADQSKPNVPPEVQEYYQAERRERMGLAWLVAFLTLVVTIAVVLGLFVGGRWVYRKVANDDKGANTGQTASDQGKPKSGVASQPVQGTTAPPSSQSQPTTPTPGQPAPSTSQPSGKKLTNTGPGDTITIFIGATIIGTLGHKLYTRRKIMNKL